MESVRSMRLKKTCPKCGAVVHEKRAVCDCGHAFARKRKARCSDDCEPKKRRKAFECEEVMVHRKEKDRVRKAKERTHETREQTLLSQLIINYRPSCNLHRPFMFMLLLFPSQVAFLPLISL